MRNRLTQLVFWLALSLIIGSLAGVASAFFLRSLEQVTEFRRAHGWILYLLPLCGLFIVFIYRRFGKGSEAGNNLLIDKIHDPKKMIPLRMAPFVLGGTLLTHLFGGSAGREGTAIQMSGAMADQLNKHLNPDPEKKKIILMAGISAGFASVFGTPLAGAFFGLEVISIGSMRYNALFACMMSAFIAHFVCLSCGAHHVHYSLGAFPDFSWLGLLWSALAGVAFGLCARLFATSTHKLTHLFKKLPSPYLAPLLGGGLVIIGALVLQSDRYLGLGVPYIVENFNQLTPPGDFILKLVFTAVTLSSGFKGGEVTPLFYIGAALGNFLSRALPLPFPLLSGMGFVAVFAGAANTPLSSTLMAMELFGSQSGLYMATACLLSYLFSGHSGIYSSQKIETRKYQI